MKKELKFSTSGSLVIDKLSDVDALSTILKVMLECDVYSNIKIVLKYERNEKN